MTAVVDDKQSKLLLKSELTFFTEERSVQCGNHLIDDASSACISDLVHNIHVVFEHSEIIDRRSDWEFDFLVD